MIAGPALLFCPGDRPERYAKAAAAADTVIIDLEDAVAPADKARAREALVAAASAASLDPATTIVRVNPATTEEFARDLQAVRQTAFTTLMLAKAESAVQVDALASSDDAFRVIALCETALGVTRSAEIAAHPAVIGMMWGAEDLIASMTGRTSRFPDGSYRDVARHARATVLLHARAFGKVAIDAVHIDIADTDGLRAEAEDAAASGFQATACIHPTQVEVIRAAYAPTEEERAWAARVLDEATRQPGVFRFEGRMIDEPILRQACELVRGRR
ncbi:MAG: CoA ester lyase [Microbacterium sp.]|uniref:HpcH/HpaI aldolase/citrate lyase family protein n=1 Tax=Microbacterium sp. TaxID=51671 RepID=UPI001ACF9EE2|nr:CoA ester lyase [Microbacterium sp.]MBN9176552.1 CoA ester lyase [Microbacterium sp.]